MGSERLPQDPLVLGQHLPVAGAAELVQELGRALDVGEEKGDGAGRQLAHRRTIVGRVTSASSDRFEERGHALADAHAQGREPVPAVAAAQLVQERDDEARAAHPERVAERDRAPVDVHPLLVEAELADNGEALRGEGLVELDEVERARIDSRASQELSHRGDRADPHHARIDARDGRGDEGAQGLDPELVRLRLAREHERRGAVVDAAGVAGRDGAARTKRRLQPGERLGRRRRPGMLVHAHLADGDELVLEPPRLLRGRPPLLRADCERVLILARDPVALGDVLTRLAHRLEREHLLQAWVGEAPAERRVPDRLVPPGERRVGLAQDERRAAHRLDAARDGDLRVAGQDRVARGHHRREARRAEPVERHARHRVGQSGEERGHAGHVAIVLPGLVRAAEVDVVDRGGVHPRALDGARDRDPGQVVGPHAREDTSVPADRRPDRREDDCAAHAGIVGAGPAPLYRMKSIRTGAGNAPSASPRCSSSVTALRPSSP